MTEKETHTILYDKSAAKLILTGSFLSDIDRFRQQLFRAVYMKSDYDALDKADVEKQRTIQIIMTNCPGGVVADMFALIALLRIVRKELPSITFHLHCCGLIQSSATLFMASDVFSRVALDRYCSIQIHNVETTFKGDSSFKKRRMETLAKNLEQTEQLMCEIYKDSAERRGKTGANWREIIDNGNNNGCLLAKEVLDMGLCDEIL